MSISAALGEMREVKLPQGTIRYRERGTGEPIVFLHGFFVNDDLWRKVVPELATDFRCITPDWPLGSHEVPMNAAADLSPASVGQLVADFLAALDLNAVTLVGNDTGGGLCQVLATEHPERVGRLVLTNCDGFDYFPPPIFRPLFWGAVHVPGFASFVVWVLRFGWVRGLPIAFGWLAKRPIEPEIWDSYLAPARSNPGVLRDAIKYLRAVPRDHTLAASSNLSRFAGPALIAWAVEDRIFPLKLAEKLTEALPNARLARIEDSYAFVPEDQPQRLAELMAAFMHETAEARA
ncbi:MAG: alpha/beta hydrolase [Chloroflexi bacterium]|nr:alpha/beta hydrolase [Chloroflexota bacterium]